MIANTQPSNQGQLSDHGHLSPLERMMCLRDLKARLELLEDLRRGHVSTSRRALLGFTGSLFTLRLRRAHLHLKTFKNACRSARKTAESIRIVEQNLQAHPGAGAHRGAARRGRQ